MRLSGIFAAITTPFDHNGDIYRTKIEHNLSRWNATSLSGYVIGTSAGEGALLSHNEKIALWELCAKHAGEGRVLIADVSVEGVREAADLAHQAAGLGMQAVYAEAPSRYGGLRCAADSQALFFRALADRSPVPVIAGGICNAQLSQHPNIVAMVADGADIKELVIASRPGFQLLVGSAAELWNGLREGAQGAILAFAAAAPYAAIAVWEAYRTREEEAGLDWQSRIAHPGSLVTDVYGPAALKVAMDLNGYYGGPPRLPLTTLTAEARAEIARAFEAFSGKT